MKQISLILFIIIFTGCATNTYNTPYVNTKETVRLSSGISKSDVLNIMGEPLYVEYGDSDEAVIYWVYEVRTSDVKSFIQPTGAIEPNKIHSDKRPTSPIHRLRLEFKSNKLYKWSQMEEISKKSTHKEARKETGKKKSIFKNSMKFFFEPKISRYTLDYGYTNYGYSSNYVEGGYYDSSGNECSDWDWYMGDCTYEQGHYNNVVDDEYIRGEESRFYFGLYSGFSFSNNKIGVDFEYDFDEDLLLMLRLERANITSLGLNIHLAGGIWTFTNWSRSIEEFAFAKIGITKQISLGAISLVPGFNFMLGEDFYGNFTMQLKLK